ncbi:MAG: hypothetical protein ACOX44_08250 [Limnochordia bacterium]|jgi:hypothetical protein
MSRSSKVSARKLALLYLPIAANAGLMMLSHVINNAGLSRLSDASAVLAGYALARNLALFTEAPVLMIRQTTISLVRNRYDLRMLIGYITRLSLVLFFLTVLLVITPLGQLVLQHLLNAPEHLWGSALRAFLLFAPLPLISAIRSVYQGILLYQRHPGVITLAMTCRAVTMGIVVLGLTQYLPHWGASIGTITFLAGLTVEMAVSFAYGRSMPIAREAASADEHPVDVKAIAAFSAPLVVLGMVDGVAGCAITASLARALNPELSIAAFTVTNSVVAVLIVALQSLHQMIMVFGHELGVLPAILRFVTGVAAVGAALPALLAFLPQGRRLFTQSLGLTADLGGQALTTLQWFVPLPIVVVAADTLVGLLLVRKRSRMVAAAKIANMCVLISIALLTTRWSNNAGAAMGPMMLLSATCMEVVVLAGCLLSIRLQERRVSPAPDDT